jgi:hypothetical protein
MTRNFEFSTLNVRNDTSYTVGIIAAHESLKKYEVVDQAIRAQYPKYFKNYYLNDD